MTPMDRLRQLALEKLRLAEECEASTVPLVRDAGAEAKQDGLALAWALERLALAGTAEYRRVAQSHRHCTPCG